MATTSTAAVLYIRPAMHPTTAANTASDVVMYLTYRALAGRYSRGVLNTRSKKRLKPSSLVPFVDPQTGRIEPAWDQYLDDVGDRRLGGPNAHTLPQVEASITYSEAQALIAQAIKDAQDQWIRSIAQTLQSTVEVLQSPAAALPPTAHAAAAQIPPVQLAPAEPPEVFLRDKNGTIL